MREPVCLGSLTCEMSNLNLWGHCFSPNLVISGLAYDWRRQFGNISSMLFLPQWQTPCFQLLSQETSYPIKPVPQWDHKNQTCVCLCGEKCPESYTTPVPQDYVIVVQTEGQTFNSLTGWWRVVFTREIFPHPMLAGVLYFSCVMHWGWSTSHEPVANSQILKKMFRVGIGFNLELTLDVLSCFV